MAKFDQIVCECRRFRVIRREQLAPNGAALTREFVDHVAAVTIVPLLDNVPTGGDVSAGGDGQVCLIRNHRVAVGKTLLELPAGTLEPGEDPLETARRELAEETGFRAREITKIHEFYMSPGILNERMHLYVATGLTPGETNLDRGEEIEVEVTDWQEAIAMAIDGRIEDAKTIVGLLMWDRLRNA